MTQKSANRQLRDKIRKENNWDQLNGFNDQINEQLSVLAVIADFMRNQALMPFVSDTTVLIKKVQLLTSDVGKIRQMQTDLEAQHSNMSGNVKNDDDNIKLLNCYMGYEELVRHIEGIITPTFSSIMEMIVDAEKKLHESMRETHAQMLAAQPEATPDDSGVTDLEVREVKDNE